MIADTATVTINA